MKTLRFVVLLAVAGSELARGGDLESLTAYRAELAECRAAHGGEYDLPDVRFFLFGMGHRTKLVYRDGRLSQAMSGAVVREWKIKGDVIVPCDYRVAMETTDGAKVAIVEDEAGVWIEEAGARKIVAGTQSGVKLPSFEGFRFPRVLRVLHQEILVNVTTNGPVPNFFVYQKPWYRDGAMMALALRETGNADQLSAWILRMNEPFDRNNGGVTEPDNLGQGLFLVSLLGRGTNHPVVSKILEELPRFEKTNAAGKFISGKSDFAEHPVYQTKWLKFGLRSLGLRDPYSIPKAADSYGALFWMDYRYAHVAGHDADNRGDYPYLGWACDHFHGVAKSPLGNRDYPLTWERRASQAHYEGMKAIDAVYAEQKLSVPHTWHAAEAFLRFLAEPSDPEQRRWEKQEAEDALQDRTTIIFDGKSPDKMVCDTTLRELPDGSWIQFQLAGGNVEPSPSNYTGVTRSFDQGRTWSPLEKFDVGFPREGKTIGQGPTELMIISNRCTLFFSTHSKHWANDWRSWFLTSDDSFKTWSKPQEVPGRLKERTFIRNHIVTRDGRILLPFQHYIGPDSEQSRLPLERKFTNPRNGVLMSSDGGKTWTEHGNIRLTTNDHYFGWAENNLAELADGRIAMIIRGDGLGGVLYYAESKDGGRTWPEFAVKSDIPNPGSKATLYPLGGDAVAILHNPNPKRRTPMAMWVSFDGMKTWPYRRVLVPESCDGPRANMNYPDGFVSTDKQWLHFAFDDNRHRSVYYGAKLPPLPAK